MNANELAEIIEHLENARYIGASKASEMLRQQQAEIEALKQIIDANNLSQNIGQFVKPTNEPVAWMSKKGILSYVNDMGFTIPLYTHPVKEQDESFDRTASHMAGEYVSHPVKEQDTDCQYCKQGCIRCDARKQLTDNEIVWLWCDCEKDGTEATYIIFARAILRKSSEK